MQQIGDIKLPLQGNMKIEGTDLEILDYLFDMKLPNLDRFLSKLHEEDTPSLMVARVGHLHFVGLFMYRPPDIWLDFDGQLYQLYLSPNLPMLVHYFVDRRMHTQDAWEASLLTKIVTYLEHYIQNLSPVSHTG